MPNEYTCAYCGGELTLTDRFGVRLTRPDADLPCVDSVSMPLLLARGAFWYNGSILNRFSITLKTPPFIRRRFGVKTTQ